MKHAVLPLAFAMTLATVLLGSATGSVGSQNSSASTSASVGAIYVRRCASCHGKDGRANTVKGKFRATRDLTDSRWQADVSDERIFNSIMNGRGKMPSFGKKLTEADINSLVPYVRSLKK